MVTASGVRIAWDDVPAAVRVAVEGILGSPVVSAAPQVGGFSPGSADRVTTADGRRAFVKAVSAGLDEGSALFHRREARTGAALTTSAAAPVGVHAPRLLGVHDDGDWVALVFDDVQGDHPATPWTPDELGAVLSALEDLSAAPLPAALASLPTAADAFSVDLAGFDRLRADPPHDLDPWAARNLDVLCDKAAGAPAALTGEHLVHADVRADNVLLRTDGSVVLVDWPHACRGPRWLDTLGLLIDVRLHDRSGHHDVEGILAAHAGATTAADDLTAVLVGLTGYFLDAARRPAPSRLPTLRAFQAAEGAAALGWVRLRLDPVPGRLRPGDGGQAERGGAGPLR